MLKPLGTHLVENLYGNVLCGSSRVYIPVRSGIKNGNSALRFGGFVMARLNGWMRIVSFSIGACLLALGACPATQAQAPPVYKVDASWPKQLPNNWIMGQVGGI